MIFFLSNIYYMGGLNSKTNSDTDTINWNGIKTENVSSPDRRFNRISNEAKQIVDSLNIPTLNDPETSEFTVNYFFDKPKPTEIKKNKFSKILDQLSQTTSEELSNTSSFISSEMYDYLFNNKNIEPKKKIQQGGSNKVKKSIYQKKGGAKDDDSSSTSSTSSASDLNDILDSSEQDIKAAKNKKEQKKQNKKNKHKNKNDQPKSESDNMSGGELSYLSSTAHTPHDFSNESDKSDKSDKSEQSNETTSSAKTSELNPVNTSDINMISE